LTDAPENPFLSILRQQTALILDGGLATTLEDRGFDLNDDLWSARVLLENPAAIGQVHLDFLDAGADCITTATYQATLPGLQKRGLDRGQARAVLESAVELALAARENFWSDPQNRPGRQRPLVAASVGPYGAYLADGSEYAGRYGLGQEQLRNFHRDRWEILAASRADLLACETLPNLDEAKALLEMLHQTAGRWAWFSFSCRDGFSLCDGTPFAQAVEMCAGSPQVAAVGVNCTAPEFIGPLLEIGRQVTDKPLIVYPNSGEDFDPATKNWTAKGGHSAIPELAAGWLNQGARAIGGCCRAGPAVIKDLRRHLLD
jgi:homocysteine S-methyltransferase